MPRGSVAWIAGLCFARMIFKAQECGQYLQAIYSPGALQQRIRSGNRLLWLTLK